MFEQALKLDPGDVDALVGAAFAERNDFTYSGMAEKPGQIAKIEELLANAIRIDPTNARAYIVRGEIYRVTRRTKEAVEAAQTAVRLDPNSAAAYAQLAQDENATPAEYPQAIAHIDQAMMLSPRDTQTGRWHWIKGKTFNYMGRYQDAIREEQSALDSGYLGFNVYEQLAVAYALTGRQSEAEAAIGQARQRNPKFTIKWHRARIDDPEVIYDGMRKAGLPAE
jgi:tetratricopeptide (TPR) repeat protein